ncbi:MAG: glutamate 5-kinase [Oscillospiraceae bacterium]|jgi:glutamate 5-kinase|nr:glutamate 5-kinase [Oscillospiraceae bacterium]
MDYKKVKRAVIKVGTSTLSHKTGAPNFRRISHLVRVLSDIKNSGIEVVLVTSGAIGIGAESLGLTSRPTEDTVKQACAAVGQVSLMRIYSDEFSHYGKTVAQILITRNALKNDERAENVRNTFGELLSRGVLPIVNANDTVTTSQLGFDENDTLSAVTAKFCKADLLVLLTDVDGLYDRNPSDSDAKFIPYVSVISDALLEAATGKGTAFSSGGMSTKLKAVRFAAEENIPTVILNGDNPEILYDLFNGTAKGTLFETFVPQ